MGTSGITTFLQAEEEGNAFTSLPPISIKAETLFELGPLAFTNSMLYTLIVIAFLVIFSIIAMRRLSLVPRGAQNFAEAVVEFLLGLHRRHGGQAGWTPHLPPHRHPLYLYHYRELFGSHARSGHCWSMP